MSVAPPQSTVSGGFDTNSAFADALERARQIAAKINPGGGGGDTGGTKRPLEDNMDQLGDGSPDPKKLASVKDPIGAQLAAIHQQRPIPGSNTVTVEEWKVPDKMVGLLIGKGGEQISRLQAESGCKIQMAADSGGTPDRSCTLTGTKQSIDRAKELMGQIISRGGPPPANLDVNQVPEGQVVIDMIIPGGKVGLVIGKGGETIRQLQERACVKMVVIQDNPQQTGMDKALRISGEPSKCEFAKQLVMDLLTEKEIQNANRNGTFMGGGPPTNDYGSAPPGAQEILVPRQAVGVVIGKSGEMIRRIQQDSGGAKVQFQQGKDDGPGDRICLVSGNPEQAQRAANIIHDLIHSVLMRDQQNVGRGRGRGYDGGPGGPQFGPPGPGMGRGRPDGDMQEITYSVPANKCGLVIGKGGEVIKGINQESGAHVELSRGPPPNPHEKVFIIRGAPQQIEHAQQLINEKIGGSGNVHPNGGPPVPNGPGPGPYPTQYPQPYQQQPVPPNQHYAPQGWGNAYQHWQNQPAAPNDPTKAAADANAAAWSAYYAQFYNQQPQGQPQPQPSQQQPQPSQQQPQPATTPSGQPDYSAAWIEYYRALGKHREAEIIEQQARANQQAGQQYAQQPQPSLAQPSAPAPQGQQPSTAPQQSQPAPTGAPQGQQYGAPAPPAQWNPGAYSQQPQQQQPPPQQQSFPQQQNPYAGYSYSGYGQ